MKQENEFKWNPHVKFKPTNDEFLLPIKEPPCRFCSYWKPRRKYLANGIYDGVACCAAERMYDDFSCFEVDTRKVKDENDKMKEKIIFKASQVQKCRYCGYPLNNEYKCLNGACHMHGIPQNEGCGGDASMSGSNTVTCSEGSGGASGTTVDGAGGVTRDGGAGGKKHK